MTRGSLQVITGALGASAPFPNSNGVILSGKSTIINALQVVLIE